MKYILISSSFGNGGKILEKHTCDGKNISPELTWSNPPDGIDSFVLLMNDYNPPTGLWNHWLLYNIPKNITVLKEGISTLPEPSKLGVNSWKAKDYQSLCPPENTEYTYYFKLYGLDTMLDLHHRASSTNIKKIINRHILDIAVLSDTYKRKSHVVNLTKQKMDLKDTTTILHKKDVNQVIKRKAAKEIKELL